MQQNLTSTFPERLKTILEETGIRQTELCEKTGIGKSAMSQYIHGAFVPKKHNLHVIAEVLDVSEEWLLGYDVSRCRDSKNNDQDNKYIEMMASDDSMKGAYIPKGAVISVNTAKEPQNGDIVSICIKGEKPKLRFLHREGDRIMLTAAESGYAPQMFTTGDVESRAFEIQGVVERVEIKF